MTNRTKRTVMYEGRAIERSAVKGGPPPEVGTDIYVPTALYISHGADNFEGGLCKVTSVLAGRSGWMSAGEPTWFVAIAERPGYSYNWEELSTRQDELKTRYGTRRGCPAPNNHPKANRWD